VLANHAAPRRLVWWVLALAVVVCGLETAFRLGERSPDTRYVLPQYSLGYFWDTPLGWTGIVGGVAVNRDSVQFSSLAGFFRNEVVPVPPEDNVYVRFSGYALVGSVLAPVFGTYGGFVAVNVAFWVAGVLATFALAQRKTGSWLTAMLAALLVATAPAFAALVGQSLPYVASYGLFVACLLLMDHVRVFEHDTSPRVAAAVGLIGGMSFLFYDLYMLPAFVVVYGLVCRMPWRNMALLLAAMVLPRIVWTLYWQASQLPSYSHNETHPSEALAAWFDPARLGQGVALLKGYALLVGHGVLNIATAFLFWPVLLAAIQLWHWRRDPRARWFLSVLVAGFAPALFMLSTWPHIPRWYAYGFPAVYILAAAAAVRFARARPLVALALVLPAVVLSNLDLLGYTRPMELLLFQPTDWAYLWSH
jgi:hypothetical protein